MALNFKTPSEVADEYLQHLKAIKPEVNTRQTDSDWYIRGRVNGGVMAGLYADQKKVSNDAFPQSARREALEKHLITYFESGFIDAQQSQGNVLVSGATGTVISTGLEFTYEANGNIYVATEDVTLEAVTGSVPVQSVAAGQNQNLLEGAVLTISSPPAGLDSTATVYDGNISDGRDEESNEEAAARLLLRIRSPLAGGKVSDYVQFARDADPRVLDASVIRYINGFGSLALVIKAGTTDIDEALDNGEAIVLTPSEALLQTVEDYVDTVKITTDCVVVQAPVEIPVDVTVKVRYSTGDGTTILSGQTLTQEELVQREVQRAIYKTPAGGRQFGGSGFVVASEIEETLDLNLSADPYTLGQKVQILVDRRVDDLAASGPNRLMLSHEIAIPGTITVLEM